MKKLLVIGKVWPEPNSSAAGTRMMQLIKFFQEEKYSIVFASTAAASDFMTDLNAIEVEMQQIKVNSISFDNFLKELNPTVVLFDRFTSEEQFGWRVAQHCPDALRILDTEDLHCLRAARELAIKEKRVFSNSDLNSEIAYREIASIYRCDLTLIISTFEMSLLRDNFGIPTNLLHYIPLLADKITSATKSLWPAFNERQHFISIGNFLHSPNLDAVHYLKKAIWPLIRKKLPEAEVHVYGAYPNQKAMKLHDEKTGFLIKGRADSVKKVMSEARICLAPLRFGAGLKGKLMDAMSKGTPSITTSIGAEGMQEQLPWAGAVENSASGFAEAAVRLFTNEKEYLIAQSNGEQIINTLFTAQLHTAPLKDKIESITRAIPNHRNINFTGSMLQHHSLQSTKYMAMWIEAKNKQKHS